MENFVREGNITREIWGNGDTILFIFAGSAAEFALNKAVDWLYFTGRLPSDPLGRLFSTVGYAGQIVFSELDKANRAIDNITAIHSGVEEKRGATIPDWAYRDVLYMLIDYSIRAYELLERKLSTSEKEDVYNVFYRIGIRMGIKELPPNYISWLPIREEHMKNDLEKGKYTVDLYKQYRKHLGVLRYKILLEGQILVLPEKVRILLGFRKFSLLTPVVFLYKIARALKFDGFLKTLLMPVKYREDIRKLDRA